MQRATVVTNARQNNLKGITVKFPHHALTVITGPSGSGKSSLAFDTLYAEGQRRYIESLSTYAKQFLERMPKPDVDRIDGIFPAVAIEQKNPTTTSRSTVGTATEIHDYLRVLWARVGRQVCARCGGSVESESPTSGADRAIVEFEDAVVIIGFPPPRGEQTDHDLLVQNLAASGFVRVYTDEFHRLDALPPDTRLDERDDVVVVVDRVPAIPENRGRLADSLSTAFAEGDGTAVLFTDHARVTLSERPLCNQCGHTAQHLTPSLFSFNNPNGACAVCNGFGAILEYDESLIIPDVDRSLADGAIDPWTKPRYTSRRRLLRDTGRRLKIRFDRPWRELSQPHQELLLKGKSGRYVGVFPFLRSLERKRYKQYIRVFLRQYQKAVTCPSCHGARLRPEALSVTVGGRTIADVTAIPAAKLCEWLDQLKLTSFESAVADTVLAELQTRVRFLHDVGLGYMTLDRQTRTLSGGEAQRISLSNALGANLVDTLYVLDEPSIGLHPKDIDRLMSLLIRLRDSGNTVVVVEHDVAAIKAADYMLELGPGSGTGGGEVVYEGTVSQLASAQTATAQYVNGARVIPVPSGRRPPGPTWLSIEGATLHNIHDLDVAFPLGTFIAVTGVSGSGKSTLIHDILYRQVAWRLKGTHGAKEHLGEPVGSVRTVAGWEALGDIVLVDQSPIGRTPRSNPITYVRAFDDIRRLYAGQPLARARGLTPTDFSFNATGGGRCTTCDGAGSLVVEMVFLADVYVPCDACGGSRYEAEILEIKIKDLTIVDVLNLTVDEAIRRFRHQDKLGRALWHLQRVGLGYLRLGQPATTLSGGEAQRLKIARQLANVGKKTKRRLYILDEPTTGLHPDDVRTLLKVLDRLVDAGHSVIVIEHHLDVAKRADWIIDMGPGGGNDGGRIVAAGTPEHVAEGDGHTAHYLRPALAAGAVAQVG